MNDTVHPLRVLVLGAGATGGVFGARLIQAGATVSFGVRPPRAEALRQRALVVTFPEGVFERTVDVKVVPEFGADHDVVLLSCKAYDLETAMDAIGPAVGPDTVVIPLLNGMAHLGVLDSRFGSARVAGGTCHLASTAASDGQILQMSLAARIAFGPRCEMSRTGRRALETLASLFSRTPVECCLSEQILQEMWEKFAFLATLASATCLMRAAIGDIVAMESGRRLIADGFEACAAVAAAAGYPMREEARGDFFAMLTKPGSKLTSSMLRDLEAGHRIEAEHIVGDMLRRVRAMGRASMLLEAALVHLHARDTRLARVRNG